jgi:hypothetical protein
MARWAQMSAVMASIAWMAACEQQTEVQRETRDLQEAQKDVGKVTQQLESDLAKSREDVARLEQKVAMARQGLTDDVLQNQKELQKALQAQEHNVKTEIGQAQHEAEIHRRDTEAALKTLAESAAAPEQLNAAPPAPVENVDRDQVVPVKGGPDAPVDMPANPDIRDAPAETPAAPGTAPDTTANPNSQWNGGTATTPPAATPPAAVAPPAPAPAPTLTPPEPPAPEAPAADPNAPR